MESRKKNILTMLLIIIMVIIFGIIGYLGFELINGNVKENKSEEITDEFDQQIPTISEDELEENTGLVEDMINAAQNNNAQQENQQASSSSGKTSTSTKKNYSTSGIYIAGYWVAGTIRIPATGIKYSIFSQPNKQALERGVGIAYTTNGLNQPGNTVIAGHNYRNRLFFSKNKNLKIGDSIIIKDTSGVEVTYIINNTFITDSTDASFYQRDTGGKREITLTTCTDQGTQTGERLIVCAKEK